MMLVLQQRGDVDIVCSTCGSRALALDYLKRVTRAKCVECGAVQHVYRRHRSTTPTVNRHPAAKVRQLPLELELVGGTRYDY